LGGEIYRNRKTFYIMKYRKQRRWDDKEGRVEIKGSD